MRVQNYKNILYLPNTTYIHLYLANLHKDLVSAICKNISNFAIENEEIKK